MGSSEGERHREEEHDVRWFHEMKDDPISFWLSDGIAWVKPNGDGCLMNAPKVKAFAKEMMQKGHHQFAVDLGFEFEVLVCGTASEAGGWGGGGARRHGSGWAAHGDSLDGSAPAVRGRSAVLTIVASPEQRRPEV